MVIVHRYLSWPEGIFFRWVTMVMPRKMEPAGRDSGSSCPGRLIPFRVEGTWELGVSWQKKNEKMAEGEQESWFLSSKFFQTWLRDAEFLGGKSSTIRFVVVRRKDLQKNMAQNKAVNLERVLLVKLRLFGNWPWALAGWWFGTMEFYDFPFSWECHHPNWRFLRFFRGVGQPPTSLGYPGIIQTPPTNGVVRRSLAAAKKMCWSLLVHGLHRKIAREKGDHGLFSWQHPVCIAQKMQFWLEHMTNPWIFGQPRFGQKQMKHVSRIEPRCLGAICSPHSAGWV